MQVQDMNQNILSDAINQEAYVHGLTLVLSELLRYS